MYRNLKYLVLTLVMLLGLYPIAELTRVIVVSGEYYFPDMKGQFIAEIAIMWALYLAIVPVFLVFNNHSIRNYRAQRKEALKKAQAKKTSDLEHNANSDYIRVNYSR
jgi:flagellar biosynthesis/type III secretory pathway M-ring protein FliF/YscJ